MKDEPQATLSPPLIHVVDDDGDHLAALCDLLEARGYKVEGFSSAESAYYSPVAPDLVISDLRMPGWDGLDLLGHLRVRHPDLAVILLTGHGDVPHAVSAMRLGAEDFLEKPYDGAHLIAVIDRALRNVATRAEVTRLRAELNQKSQAALLGQSAAIQELRERIAALAPLTVDIVVTGETGTGKELAARALHEASPRRDGPFIAINCAALPEALFEIEMFGHVAGAFPGAGDKPGKLEAATGGTLVLDEIEAMPHTLQAKLLRVLEERGVVRLGEHQMRPLDLRLIALSRVDLKELTLDGTFRPELYFRIAGSGIQMPALRETGNDIALIFTHFVTQAARRSNLPVPPIDYALRQRLMRRPWPGNMRELRAVAERYALNIEQPDIAAAPPVSQESLADRVAAFEAREIRTTLDRCRGNTERAAQVLGMARRTLSDKIHRYGIRLD